MAFDLSQEDKELFEKWLSMAEPYEDDDPALLIWDGALDDDRFLATLAKRALEGRLK